MDKIKNEVTIGIPVYNGEKTIRKALDSIINQTFTNYKVIISDNGSDDTTAEICKEYSMKNSKLTYFRQERNIGALDNFKFVLNSANSKYFVWLAADDWWDPAFLEKNVGFLKTNKGFVGSNGKVEYFDIQNGIAKTNRVTTRSKVKKYNSYDEYRSGNFVDRVSFYLRLNRAENLYGVFETSFLKKCMINCLKRQSVAMDLKMLLFIQKFGEIKVFDDVLMHRSGKGISSRYSDKKIFSTLNDFGAIGELFPFLSFSCWILRNLGSKVFFKNLGYLAFINASATKYQIKQFLKIH